jgi:hypothetical protein
VEQWRIGAGREREETTIVAKEPPGSCHRTVAWIQASNQVVELNPPACDILGTAQLGVSDQGDVNASRGEPGEQAEHIVGVLATCQ